MTLEQKLQKELGEKLPKDATEEIKKNLTREIVKDFLAKQDFSQKSVEDEATDYIKSCYGKISDRKNLEEVDALAMHFLTTKLICKKMGVPDVKLIYRDRTEKDAGVGAFYTDEDNSVTSFYASVFNPMVVKNNPLKGSAQFDYRVQELMQEIRVIAHELEHARQYRDTAYKQNLDKRLYLIQKEKAAKEIGNWCTLYSGDEKPETGVYRANHDDFFIELDANETGYSFSPMFVNQFTSRAGAIATKAGFRKQVEVLQEKIENFDKITWKHNTNPNQAPVQANYKMSQIIDTVLPAFDASVRKKMFEKYPSLKLTYLPNGKRKTLDEVEKDKIMKISLEKAAAIDPKKKERNLKNIEDVYGAVIEGDALFSLEFSLRHIARLQANDEFYHGGGANKELKCTMQKVNDLLQVVEEYNYKYVEKLIKKYSSEFKKNKISSVQDMALYEEKHRSLWTIRSMVEKNDQLKKAFERDKKIDAKHTIEEKKAREVLEKVFPNFKFKPVIETMSGTLQKIVVTQVPNNYEKNLLFASYRAYMAYLLNHPEIQKAVPPVVVFSSIKKIYGEDFKIEEVLKIEAKVRNGEEKLVKNCYQTSQENDPKSNEKLNYGENIHSENKPTQDKSIEQDATKNEPKQKETQSQKEQKQENNSHSNDEKYTSSQSQDKVTNDEKSKVCQSQTPSQKSGIDSENE